MNALLTTDVFRDFELSGAQITTFMSFSIDGTWHPSFFSQGEDRQDEKDSAAGDGMPSGEGGRTADTGHLTGHLTPWKNAAPVIFSLIRGKNPPLSMKLVLRLMDPQMQKLVSHTPLSYAPDDIKGVFLNISYDQGKVTCTTGTSLRIFTTDRSLDLLWDDAAEKFLGQIT